MLNIRTQRLERITILCLQGRMVVGEINSLRLAVHAQSNVDLVVLNLAQVSMIDASGVGILLELRQWSSERGIELRLMAVGARVRQILEITCLDTVFEISSPAEILSLAGSQEVVCEMALLSCGELGSSPVSSVTHA
jgi:anti-anti-sigma factor